MMECINGLLRSKYLLYISYLIRMLRTCLLYDIIVHDFLFNYFCKHFILCICYCSNFLYFEFVSFLTQK